jgi:hypothetical protein
VPAKILKRLRKYAAVALPRPTFHSTGLEANCARLTPFFDTNVVLYPAIG